MYEKIYNLIKQNEIKGDFTYANMTEKMCTEAEAELGLSIPPAYKWFLNTFGHGGIGGIEIIGIGKTGKMLFVDATKKYRLYGLSNDLIVIENCDEWVYCIDSKNNNILMWSIGNNKCTIAYKNFETYLVDRIHDVLENR